MRLCHHAQSPDTYALIKDPSGITDTSDMTKITVGGEKYYANDIAKSRRQLCLSLMKDQGTFRTSSIGRIRIRN